MKKSKPQHQWTDDQPIYRQLLDQTITRILDCTYREGDMLPSVRQLASEYQVNPLTAAKAYKELARDGFIQTLRGEGLIVAKGARQALFNRERARFLKEEWPGLRARLQRLGIGLRELAQAEAQEEE